jgi:hypothetical protein
MQKVWIAAYTIIVYLSFIDIYHTYKLLTEVLEMGGSLLMAVENMLLI